MTKAEKIYKTTDELKKMLQWPWAWQKRQAQMDSLEAELELKRLEQQETVNKLTESFIRGESSMNEVLKARLTLRDTATLISEAKALRAELMSEAKEDEAKSPAKKGKE